MVKKIITVVLCLVLSLSVMTGCNLITHNNERDAQQVIATIAPIEASGTKTSLDENGYEIYEDIENISSLYYKKDKKFYTYEEGNYYEANISEESIKPRTEEWSFKSQEKYLYKSQLINYINQYASTYINNYGYTLEQAVKYFMDQLVTRELILIEADRLEAAGKIIWKQKDFNYVEQAIYEYLDTRLKALYNEILNIKDDNTEDEESSEEPKTTYPIYKEETEEPEEDTSVWTIEDDKSRWPAYYGDADTKSLQREGMRRLIIELEENIRSDFRLTKEQLKKVDEDFDKIKKVEAEKGIQFVYPMLKDTFTVDWMYRKTAIESRKLTMIQEYIQNSVEITDEDVQNRYKTQLKSQQTSFNESLSNYDTYINDGKPVLYHPDLNRYIFVNHILLQFSEEQKAYLESYKAKYGQNSDRYKAERENLINSIVAYEHVNGEDDLTRPLSVKTIYNEINSKMSALESRPELASKEFERLTYKYNQDPGAFEKKNGYAVIYELKDGDTDNWMKEFSDAARTLKEDYRPGQLYDGYVITDYGVHIMYFAGVPQKSIMTLNDYTDFMNTQTYYDLYSNELKEAKQKNAYTEWQDEQVYYYKNTSKKVTTYENRYKDLYNVD